MSCLKYLVEKQKKAIAFALILSAIYLGFFKHIHPPSALPANTILRWKSPSVALMPRFNTPTNNNGPPPTEPGGGLKKRMPGCIVFGVSKCGTAAVMQFVKAHPSVVGAPQEIHYFNQPKIQEESGLEWYLDQMPESYPDQVTIIKSPDYFQCPEAPTKLFSVNKHVKLILLLRDPVVRVVSEYSQLYDKLEGRMAQFEQWAIVESTGEVNVNVPTLKISKYVEHLERWYSVFSPQQIHVIESNDLISDPLTEMKRLEVFLSISPFFTDKHFYFNATKGFHCVRPSDTDRGQCLGKTKGRKHIPVQQEVLDKLYRFYEPYNQRLFQMLNRTFKWPSD